jgi:ATP-dependent HslUV protease ATP-binding subunit HslU
MIGPTGVGKTEIARRLARLAKAPFVKVEATKFTEVGYVGRDVDSIVRDLVDVAVKMTRERRWAGAHRAEDAAEERMLDALLPRPRVRLPAPTSAGDARADARRARSSARCCARARSTTARSRSRCAAMPAGVEIMAPPGMEEMTQQLQSMFQNLGGQRTRARKLKVREALKLLTTRRPAS